MKRFTSSLLLIAELFILIGWTAAAPSAEAAATACTPTVAVRETKETSVRLKITCADFKKDKVSIKILVTNKDNDSDSTKTAKATLGKSGSVTLKISGLDSATLYSFKVRVKKGSDKYSPYSSSVDTTTKGADYDIAISKINGITDNTVKLNVVSDDLENQSVNLLASYKRKNDWSTKTFTLTLDKDGEGAVTLDGLKSETEYSFKVKIRKNGETKYSKYSEIKKATTDSD